MTIASGRRVVIRKAEEKDLRAIARISADSFAGNGHSIDTAFQWVQCMHRAFPAYQYFVAEGEEDGAKRIAGYIGWRIDGGFARPEPVIELEQIAVAQEWQNQKIAQTLETESLELFLDWVRKNNPAMRGKIVAVVWAYSTNTNALGAYAHLFGDGVTGLRTQYDGKPEVMLRHQIPS